MQYYRIGEVQFSWEEKGNTVIVDDMMEKFLISPAELDLTRPIIDYHEIQQDLEFYKDENRLYRDGLYELYETKQDKLLIYHWAKKRFGYGFFASEMEKDRYIQIFMHPNLRDEISMNATRFFSTVGLHSHLLRHGQAVLHAAYIEWQGSAILFAAPSQTGKSTQAKLWEQYLGARLLNEDRVLLGKKEGVWWSYGYPCSGSSPICLNETYPLRAIVLLEQGRENRIARLSSVQTIQKLMAGIEVYLWSQKEIDLAMDLAVQLTSQVPVIRLICRPDEDAVYTLKKYLEGVL